MPTRPDTLQGSLPLLVLTVLHRRGPLHGYAITSHIHSLSDALRVEEGSLYPSLIGWKKLVGSKHGQSPPNTTAGRAPMKSRPLDGASSVWKLRASRFLLLSYCMAASDAVSESRDRALAQTCQP
jgi:hypothetical protein